MFGWKGLCVRTGLTTGLKEGAKIFSPSEGPNTSEDVQSLFQPKQPSPGPPASITCAPVCSTPSQGTRDAHQHQQGWEPPVKCHHGGAPGSTGSRNLTRSVDSGEVDRPGAGRQVGVPGTSYRRDPTFPGVYHRRAPCLQSTRTRISRRRASTVTRLTKRYY